MKGLPIGIQTFSEIINRNNVYVDKTELIFNLVSAQKYYFLSRPRRFGKSLLVSTLQAYFEGKKELFKGMKIESLEQEWTEYPVVTLSFASCKSDKIDNIVKYVSIMLSEQEVKFGLRTEKESSSDDKAPDINFNARLKQIIENAYQQTGKQVVLLIDEYDALMLNTITDISTQKAVRVHMNNLFSPIKDLDPKLRFVFITGITKLSQMSIFSTLNNLTDISLLGDYATICGFTENEVKTQLKSHIESFATKFNWTFDETIAKLKQRYDGYHFADSGDGVFNPFSLLKALNEKRLENYWFKSATPSSLISLLKANEVFKIESMDNILMENDRFDTPVERITDLIPFLYQSGYLTIKGYYPEYDQYMIGFPNQEVRYGFSYDMIRYLAPSAMEEGTIFRRQIVDAIRDDNPEFLLQHLQTFLRKIPYPNADTPEWYYQNLLYAILATCGFTVQNEIRTSAGRIDFALFSPKSIFLFEFKLNKTPEEALVQIDEKQYTDKFSFEGKKVWKIGVNFSSKERTIDGWKMMLNTNINV